MSSSSSKALCLLALVVIVSIGAASAAKPLPGSCLVAASTLCANTHTHGMSCLRELALNGDARVPSACAEALMAAGEIVNPRRNQASRVAQLARLLTEGGACAANTCTGNVAQCNDVKTGCSGCSEGTYTVPSGADYLTVAGASKACSNVCCKGDNGRAACCLSSNGTVFCLDTRHGACNAAR